MATFFARNAGALLGVLAVASLIAIEPVVAVLMGLVGIVVAALLVVQVVLAAVRRRSKRKWTVLTGAYFVISVVTLVVFDAGRPMRASARRSAKHLDDEPCGPRAPTSSGPRAAASGEPREAEPVIPSATAAASSVPSEDRAEAAGTGRPDLPYRVISEQVNDTPLKTAVELRIAVGGGSSLRATWP